MSLPSFQYDQYASIFTIAEYHCSLWSGRIVSPPRLPVRLSSHATPTGLSRLLLVAQAYYVRAQAGHRTLVSPPGSPVWLRHDRHVFLELLPLATLRHIPRIISVVANMVVVHWMVTSSSCRTTHCIIFIRINAPPPIPSFPSSTISVRHRSFRHWSIITVTTIVR